MDFNEYQKWARTTAQYPDIGKNLIYPILGLCGETGEIAEKIKKVIRNDGGVMTPEKRTELAKELGDVVWYVATIASELGITFDDVIRLNKEKLESRKVRDAIKSTGDNR
jgi:NTP pyrophosphatase (non-canonical NTP hydrolase)